MNNLNVLCLIFLGLVGLAVGGLSVDALAVTADDVVCNGCVKSSDIANNSITSLDIQNFTVRSVDLNPSITLGSPSTGGLFRVRTTVNPAALVFEADGRTPGAGVVRIGRGGSAEINENTDLLVIDPDFTASSTEPVMFMDASTGTLSLGSGNALGVGEQGELWLKTSTGGIGMFLNGNGTAFLGRSLFPGSLAIDDGTGSYGSIQMEGSTGNLTNQFGGSGLVKAWARINADGTVASCYRCDPSVAETRSLGTGQYEVDFTPVGTDVSSRPWTCSLGTGAVFSASGEISCVQRSGDPSSLFVFVRSTAGALLNQAYTVVVY